MIATWSAAELVEVVEEWCKEHRLVPANGQASERVSERSIRYYRTLGLLHPPAAGGGFTEIHRLQLIALRILQMEGLPLRRIRLLLHGRSQDELIELQRRAKSNLHSVPGYDVPSPEAARSSERQSEGLGAGAAEMWKVMRIDAEFSLISRNGRELDAATLESVRRLLGRHNQGKGGENESGHV